MLTQNLLPTIEILQKNTLSSFHKTISNYLDKPEQLRSNYSVTYGYGDDEIVKSALIEAGETPVSRAIFEIACLAAINNPSDTDYYSVSNSFFSEALRSTSPKPMLSNLLDAAEETGLEEVDLALSIISSNGHNLNFGWIPVPYEGPFGGASDPRYLRHSPPTSFEPANELESYIWSLPDPTIFDLLTRIAESKTCNAVQYLGSLAKFRPEIFSIFLEKSIPEITKNRSIDWRYVASATMHYDSHCLEYIKRVRAAAPKVESSIFLDHSRAGIHHEIAVESCIYALEDCESRKLKNKSTLNHIPTLKNALLYLTDTDQEAAISYFRRMLESDILGSHCPEYILESAAKNCATNWTNGGDLTFAQIGNLPIGRNLISCFRGLLSVAPLPAEAQDWSLALLEKHAKAPAQSLAELWTVAVEKHPNLFVEELWQLASNKSKTLRSIGVEGLTKALGKDAISKANELLGAKKADIRLGAISIMETLGDHTALSHLKAALDTEKSDKVRREIHNAISACDSENNGNEAETQAIPLAELEAAFTKKAKTIKLPKNNWLDLTSLPALVTTSGEPISELALTFLIARQAKEKTITPAPDAAALLAHIDHSKSGDFALALFKQWLASGSSRRR